MKQVAVIGGGVVGLSCALALQDDGHQVTIVDPGPVGFGASAASCGCIAVGEIVPLSQPGMLAKVPGWLINPEAPLALRPSTALRMLPWFVKFAANARAKTMRSIAADLASLTFQATQDFKDQMARYGIRDMLIERPIIKLFDNDADKALMGATFGLARELGCVIDEISGAEAHEIDPSIAADFQHAAVLRDWSFVADCVRLVKELNLVFLKRGGSVINSAARSFEINDRKCTATILDNADRLSADEFILAAGTASKALSKSLGVPLPVEGLAGYWTGLGDPGVDLKHTVFYPAGGFGITPHENTLAVAGTIEFAGLNAAPNWRRADVLVERAKRVLPGLQTATSERRIGRRPFVPDTRPVIGRSDKLSNVVFATGHGQLGLTLGSTTGRLVSDIIAGRNGGDDLKAFSPDRF